jgi:hypothetical protein
MGKTIISLAVLFGYKTWFLTLREERILRTGHGGENLDLRQRKKQESKENYNKTKYDKELQIRPQDHQVKKNETIHASDRREIRV